MKELDILKLFDSFDEDDAMATSWILADVFMRRDLFGGKERKEEYVVVDEVVLSLEEILNE